MPKSTCVVVFTPDAGGGGVSLWGAALATLPVPCSERHSECASSVISLKMCGVCDSQGYGAAI